MTQTKTNLKAEKPLRRPPGTTYWLITNGRRDVLTLYYDGAEMLPVFSYREEAEMFLRLGILGYDWRASESSTRELVSVLSNWCRFSRTGVGSLRNLCGREGGGPRPVAGDGGGQERGPRLAVPVALPSAHSTAGGRPLEHCVSK